MEAESSKRRLRAPNGLSDCTNTISSITALATVASSQSSSSYTVKLKRQNPKLASDTLHLSLPSSRLVLRFCGNFNEVLFNFIKWLVHGGRGTCRFCAYIYSTKADYKVRREIDFFGEISGVSMSPNDKSLYIGIWDRSIWREKPAR